QAAAAVPIQQDTGKAQFTEVRLHGDGTLKPGDSLSIAFAVQAKEALGPIVFNISIYRTDGDWVVGQTSREAGVYWPAAAAGEVRRGRIELAPLSLAPGDYLVAVGACSEDYTLCYALTDLSLKFSVRADYPTWG